MATKKFQNTQKYCECQLVSLWNAVIFHNQEIPTLGTKFYRQVVLRTNGMHGACFWTDMRKEFKRMGIHPVRGKYDLKWVRRNLPVEFSVFLPERGYHSTLAIGAYKNKLLFANWAEGRLHWAPWSRVLEVSNKEELPYAYRKHIHTKS